MADGVERTVFRCQTLVGHLKRPVSSPGSQRLMSMSAEGDLGRQISSHKVNVNGVDIHYLTTGTGNHVVLLLGGALGFCGIDFKPQLENINKDLFTLIAFDPRGFGGSYPPERDWPDRYAHRDAADAAKLMDTLGHSRYSLIGWSYGGLLALIVAATCPGMIRKMVLSGATSYASQLDMDAMRAIQNIDDWNAKKRAPLLKLYGEEYFRKLCYDYVEAYNHYFKKEGGDICKGDLKNIVCPTLVIFGMKDVLISKSHADYISENINNSKLVTIEDGSHHLHLYKYKIFNSMVEHFLVQREPQL